MEGHKQKVTKERMEEWVKQVLEKLQNERIKQEGACKEAIERVYSK